MRNRLDHKRLTEAYDLMVAEQARLTRTRGRRTLGNLVDRKIFQLRYQFLPHYFSNVPPWRLKLRSFGGPRVLPDFACVGPLKSGTTDLCSYLLQHPCILPPLSKEFPMTNPRAWLPYYPTVREKRQVEMEHGKALCGYFYPNLSSLSLIDAYHGPDRTRRSFSCYGIPWIGPTRITKRICFMPGKEWRDLRTVRRLPAMFNLALDLFPTNPLPAAFVNPSGKGLFLQAGIYVKSVELWISRFGRENVLIVRSEDFFKDSAAIVCSIHEFLGIPPITPDKHPIMNQNPMNPPPFEPETRRKLQEFYRPWNEKLYALIERDMEWDRERTTASA